MYESWPISRRINGGFLFLTVMLIGLAFVSHRSVGALGNGYSEYRNIAKQTVAASALVEDIFEARVASFKYRIDTTPAIRQEVLDNIDEVLNSPEFLATFAVNPARLAEVERLVDLAAQYRSNFVEMSDSLAQAQATRTIFEDVSDEIKIAVNDIFATAVQGGNPAVVTAAGDTKQSGLVTIVQAKQYLISSQPADLEAVQAEYAVFERALDRLTATTTDRSISQQIAQLKGVLTGYLEMLLELSQSNKTALDIQRNVLDVIGPEIQDGFDVVSADIVTRQNELGPEGADIVSNLQVVIPAIGVLATLSALIAAFIIGRWITGSVKKLADTTDALAAGNLEIEISGSEHNHELGRMARALTVFRKAQIERNDASEERARLRAEQDTVVKTMQNELALLASGDLTTKITQEFSPDYEELRTNFNAAVAALQQTLSMVADTTAIIGGTTSETQKATSELSQRTENQAATLEETAAALDELTASIKSAAEHAKSVDVSVKKARSEATKNGEIVAQAVNAMGEIEESSKQITQVIGVIDDIAFQTNLLALNAGVEAARAGDSGKGFAVVASEVRALAQRSAEAAKEISALIANSSRHVEQGTQLVGNAGDALSEIITQVDTIASMTTEIATSAHEQSIGLSEINIGVNQLDQATQQNAAMVQASMTRGDALALETSKLHDLVNQFKVTRGNDAAADISRPIVALEQAINETSRPQQNRPIPPAARVHSNGNTAEAIWEDF